MCCMTLCAQVILFSHLPEHHPFGGCCTLHLHTAFRWTVDDAHIDSDAHHVRQTLCSFPIVSWAVVFLFFDGDPIMLTSVPGWQPQHVPVPAEPLGSSSTYLAGTACLSTTYSTSSFVETPVSPASRVVGTLPVRSSSDPSIPSLKQYVTLSERFILQDYSGVEQTFKHACQCFDLFVNTYKKTPTSHVEHLTALFVRITIT